VQERNVTYIDPDFPPVATSLYDTNTEPMDGASGAAAAESKAVNEQIVWRRPAEFAPDEEFCLFEEAIEPEDINQVGSALLT
jgi:hypothetical protein